MSLFTESVSRAITSAGLTNIAPVEAVSEAAARDINVQYAYQRFLRTSVQSMIRNNEDFTPERYPNASSYFSRPQ